MDIDTDAQKLFAELLWDRLAETDESNWSDYDRVVQTFVKVASTSQLIASRDSLPEFVQEQVDHELEHNRNA